MKYLSIKDTFSIHHPPEEVFKPLNSLEELHLEALCNLFIPFGFDCTTIDKRLKHVPSLKKIFIDKKIIQSTEKGFLSLEKMEGLYFVTNEYTPSCEVVALGSDLFENLANSPQTKLVLDYCNIIYVAPRWIKYLMKLEEVYLAVATYDYEKFWVYFSTGL